MNTDIDSLAVIISDIIRKKSPNHLKYKNDQDFLDSFIRGEIDSFLWHESVRCYKVDIIRSLPHPDEERVKLLFAAARRLSLINRPGNQDSIDLFNQVKSIYTSQ